MTGQESFAHSSDTVLATQPMSWADVGIAAVQVMRSAVHRVRMAQTSIHNIGNTTPQDPKHQRSLQQGIVELCHYRDSKTTQSIMMLHLEIGASYYQHSNEPYKPHDRDELFRALSCGAHISEIVTYLLHSDNVRKEAHTSLDARTATNAANEHTETQLNYFGVFLGTKINAEALTKTMKTLFPPLLEKTYELIPMLCSLTEVPQVPGRNDPAHPIGPPLK